MLFKGKAKVRKRKGSSQIRAKQTQENKEGRIKGPLHISRKLVNSVV